MDQCRSQRSCRDAFRLVRGNYPFRKLVNMDGGDFGVELVSILLPCDDVLVVDNDTTSRGILFPISTWG